MAVILEKITKNILPWMDAQDGIGGHTAMAGGQIKVEAGDAALIDAR